MITLATLLVLVPTFDIEICRKRISFLIVSLSMKRMPSLLDEVRNLLDISLFYLVSASDRGSSIFNVLRDFALEIWVIPYASSLLRPWSSSSRLVSPPFQIWWGYTKRYCNFGAFYFCVYWLRMHWKREQSVARGVVCIVNWSKLTRLASWPGLVKNFCLMLSKSTPLVGWSGSLKSCNYYWNRFWQMLEMRYCSFWWTKATNGSV